MQIQVAKDARREGRRRSCRWQNQPFYLFSDVIRFNFKGPNISVNIFSTDLFPRFYSDCKLACLGDDELIHCMWRGLQKVGAITLKGTSLLHVHEELEICMLWKKGCPHSLDTFFAPLSHFPCRAVSVGSEKMSLSILSPSHYTVPSPIQRKEKEKNASGAVSETPTQRKKGTLGADEEWKASSVKS